MDLILELLLTEFTLAQIAIAIFIVFIATGIQYAMGIGFGTIVGPLLALININFVPVASLLLTCFAASASLVSERDKVSWIQLRSTLSGRVVGAIFAAFTLSLIPSEKTFLLIFGLIVASFVLLSFSGLRIPFNLKTLGLAGTISGFTATITGVGGPPIALIYQDQPSVKARPTLQAYFAIASIISLAVLFSVGRVGTVHLLGTLVLLPGLLGGPMVGPILRPFANQRFKYVILGITGFAAIILIVRGLS